jgi:hypothetical protein
MKRLLLVIALALGAATAFAQVRRPFGGLFGEYEPTVQNPEYDGRFTFARIKYRSGPGGYYYRGLPAWAHGYIPMPGGTSAERNLMKIMDDISYLHPRVDESAVFTLDDPELCHYPVAYMTEPGFWTMDDKEGAALRAYLLKGGFLVVDDFRVSDDPRAGGGWENFEANIRRALPEARIVDLDPSMQVYDSFFRIESFDIVPQSYDRGRPIFRGIFEDNDPKKRLMVIVNYNTDISDFWEFSATGFRPIEESNEAYKIGVNYIIYGMTH